VSLSSEVLPEIREYERMSTTVVNAMVKPIVIDYVADLQKKLQGFGIKAPL
jgi:N-methylhydantoinase A